MWLLLGLLASAQAVEIGKTKKHGIGAMAGLPVSISGKVWSGDRIGFIGNIDYHPFLQLVGVRVGTEYDLAHFGEWDWGAFNLTANGVASIQGGGGIATPGTVIRIGGGGGIGLSILLSESPVEIYNQFQLMIYPASLAGGSYWAGGLVGFGSGLGVRYYF